MLLVPVNVLVDTAWAGHLPGPEAVAALSLALLVEIEANGVLFAWVPWSGKPGFSPGFK